MAAAPSSESSTDNQRALHSQLLTIADVLRRYRQASASSYTALSLYWYVTMQCTHVDHTLTVILLVVIAVTMRAVYV
jgi:hypothetical protein